ncbi:hypothetical protein FNF27_03596 [Cafeteria roenbergensis]|uniref:Uncharacterized protein n=1 Tax=Cafeteria roenbergensis TaxID=33653 RepID=A0A5A8EGD4_CAFRO|nr:hypothetical protein FNF27_03596 [Cafeteria roenbergensis]
MAFDGCLSAAGPPAPPGSRICVADLRHGTNDWLNIQDGIRHAILDILTELGRQSHRADAAESALSAAVDRLATKSRVAELESELASERRAVSQLQAAVRALQSDAERRDDAIGALPTHEELEAVVEAALASKADARRVEAAIDEAYSSAAPRAEVDAALRRKASRERVRAALEEAEARSRQRDEDVAAEARRLGARVGSLETALRASNADAGAAARILAEDLDKRVDAATRGTAEAAELAIVPLRREVSQLRGIVESLKSTAVSQADVRRAIQGEAEAAAESQGA